MNKSKPKQHIKNTLNLKVKATAVKESHVHQHHVSSDHDLQTKVSCTGHCRGINDQLGELIAQDKAKDH